MRLSAGFIVVLALAVAACGGGGKSSILPGALQTPATTPQHQARSIAVVLNVPPAAQQARSKRPFYISRNTQSIAFTVVPNGSSSPIPAPVQAFPVTTPSPCATIAAGGESCTFEVTAPYGSDIFYVDTYAVPSPSASTTPLATFVSGAITVGSPAPNATPLAFTMNGVVSTVAITVPSPDPSNTPNTQVFTAALATSVPLGITPYDASGAAILSDAFSAPITVSVSPASSGVGLKLSASCSTSSGNATPAPSIQIGCASDLANASVAYDGSVSADNSDHIVDTFSISSTQFASPAPQPATVALASNITKIEPSSTAYTNAYLQALPNNVIAFMLGGSGYTTAAYGTIDVTHNTTSALATLSGVTPAAFYVMSDGSMWVVDGSLDDLDCFNSGGSLQTQSSLATFMTTPDDVTYDGTQIWVTGYGSSSSVVVHAPLTGSCALGTVASTTLPNEIYGDSALFMAPQSGGGVLIDGAQTGGAWTVNSSGAATYLNPGFTAGSGFGSGVAIDGTGTGYFGFYPGNGCSPCYPLFTLAGGGSSLSSIGTVEYPSATFGALAVFGPNGGAADRLAMADTSNETLAFFEGPNGTSPVTIPLTLSHGYFRSGRNVAFSTKGAGFTAFQDGSTNEMAIARIYLTTTWSVPQTALEYSNVLSIDERGDSGPFTLTPVSAPSCYSGATSIVGTDHAFYLGNDTISPCTVTLQVSDRNKRSQTVTVTIPGTD